MTLNGFKTALIFASGAWRSWLLQQTVCPPPSPSLLAVLRGCCQGYSVIKSRICHWDHPQLLGVNVPGEPQKVCVRVKGEVLRCVHKWVDAEWKKHNSPTSFCQVCLLLSVRQLKNASTQRPAELPTPSFCSQTCWTQFPAAPGSRLRLDPRKKLQLSF